MTYQVTKYMARVVPIRLTGAILMVLVMAPPTVSGQTASQLEEAMVPAVISIKFNEQVQEQVAPTIQDGVALSGIGTIDRLNAQLGAVRLEPIFRTLAPGPGAIPRTPGRDGAHLVGTQHDLGQLLVLAGEEDEIGQDAHDPPRRDERRRRARDAAGRDAVLSNARDPPSRHQVASRMMPLRGLWLWTPAPVPPRLKHVRRVRVERLISVAWRLAFLGPSDAAADKTSKPGRAERVLFVRVR
jgi:hypothetical protein